MARPRKAPDEKRTSRLPAARVTEAERVFIEHQAALAGLDPSEFVRRAALRQRIAPRRSDVSDTLLLEINRAGVNLNQIARAVNRGQDLPADFPDVLADLSTALRKVLADGS